MGEAGLRSVSTALLIVLLPSLLLLVPIPVNHAQTENAVFVDSFEAYQAGSFPSAGG
jgi:hypothetical protein